jgi:hypothetical protein
MIPEIQRIAQLQRQYSSTNTPDMQERGFLIRRDLPELLRGHLGVFKAHLGRFAADLAIEGRDGMGRKTEAPWVRLYSQSLSPSATTGFYVILHFALDGRTFFVTVGCGSSKWNAERGDLTPYSDKELADKVAWAKNVLRSAGRDTSNFSDRIAIGSTRPLPRSFEKATVLAKALDPNTTDLTQLVDTISEALQILSVIYEAFDRRADLPTSEAIDLDLRSILNPKPRDARGRQGYGLTPEERRAVELHAMAIARTHLEGLAYRVTDTSANNPFDFLAESAAGTIKVEVKGTTSTEVDAILMTSNEVELHTREAGKTALAIVSEIVLVKNDDGIRCRGGTLEFHLPWDISKWTLSPKAYAVVRPNESMASHVDVKESST